jgi:hypothetical protein
MRPFLPDTSDQRLELPPEEGGWGAVAADSPSEGGSAWRLVSFLSDVFLSEFQVENRYDVVNRRFEDVCYWTIFTDLALSLFYFSVWELGTHER